MHKKMSILRFFVLTKLITIINSSKKKKKRENAISFFVRKKRKSKISAKVSISKKKKRKQFSKIEARNERERESAPCERSNQSTGIKMARKISPPHGEAKTAVA